MAEPTKLPVEPVHRSFEMKTEYDDLNRLAIIIDLFAEMDEDESRRTLRYLQARFDVLSKPVKLKRRKNWLRPV